MFIKTSLNTYSWGHINDTFGLDNDQFAIDELVLQSKKLEDDDSGNSTGKFPFLTTCSIPFRNVDVLEL